MKSMKALQQSKNALFVSLNSSHCTETLQSVAKSMCQNGSDRFSCNIQSHCNEIREVPYFYQMQGFFGK